MLRQVPSLKWRRFAQSSACALLTVLSVLAPARAPGQSKAAGDPPVIDEQPIGRVASDGGHVTLSVAAHGTAPLSYQWRRNGGLLPTAPHITGNATAVLNIDPASTNDTGGYSVIITNGSGAVTSSVASVAVNLLGVLLTPQGATGALVSIFGQIGDVYRIEVSSNFSPYFTNGYATNATGQAQFFDLNPGGAFRQLRIRFDHMLPVLYPTGVGTLRAYGKLNQAWRFDASPDFSQWFSLATITNTTGWVTFGDPRDFLPSRQFYRIAPP